MDPFLWQVQNLRKDSGLKVEDRIEIGILGSKELNDAVNSYQNHFPISKSACGFASHTSWIDPPVIDWHLK